ncbi:hypothetical protein GCM10022275_23060 [Tessaracoccus defluvii]
MRRRSYFLIALTLAAQSSSFAVPHSFAEPGVRQNSRRHALVLDQPIRRPYCAARPTRIRELTQISAVVTRGMIGHRSSDRKKSADVLLHGGVSAASLRREPRE